jgi:hypothetical protein
VGLGQHPREPGPDGVVERDQQRGDDVVALEVEPGGERALDPVHDPLLDVRPHKGVEAELGAEVVVQRPGRGVRGRGQRPDVNLVVAALAERLQRRQHEPPLRAR